MSTIIRGTTPTLTFHVKDETLDLNNIAVIYVTFKTKPGIPKQKEKTFSIEDLNIDASNHIITLYMTQEDTLEFINESMECQIRVRFNNDRAYASNIDDLAIGRILKDGVI